MLLKLTDFARPCWLAILIAAHASAVQAAKNSLLIEPSQDNSIYEPFNAESELMSNGKGVFLFTGRTGLDGGFKARRALLKFDLAAEVPAGAHIVFAELTLYQSKAAPSSPPVDIGLYPLLAAWGEGNSNALGAEGQGAPAEENDVTWTHRLHPGDTWTSQGGDYSMAPTAEIEIGQTLGHYTWGCSAEMLTQLNDWLESPETNHGWILIGGEEGGQTGHRFNSRENSTPANRPVLTLAYITEDWVFGHAFEENPCP